MESRQEEINKLLLNFSFRNWALRANTQDFEEWGNYFKDDSELGQLALESKQVVIQIELSESKQVQEDFQSFERFIKNIEIQILASRC